MASKVISMTVFLLFGALTLTACTGDSDDVTTPAETQPPLESIEQLPPAEPADFPTIADEDLPLLDGSLFEPLKDAPLTLLQLTPVAPGEELLVLHTTMGDVTLRLFPDEAPQAVENFVTHARNGYYDGITFHRVIPEFMIQGGCPLGTGTGGESIWGSPFGLEPSLNLRHFRGALAMAHAGGAMGSQFYIVQNSAIDPGFMNEMQEIINSQNMPMGRFENGQRIYVRDVFSVQEANYFMENGGTPFLDWLWNPQGHTVFGHVVEGMDVVDAIATVATQPGDRPVEDVIINNISFITR